MTLPAKKVLGPEAHTILGYEIKRAVLASGEPVYRLGAPKVSQGDFRNAVSLIMTGVFCYLGISVFYQTRDRFRFIIPYVEFRAAERGPRPIILDSNVLIDGRFADLVDAQFVDAQIVVPRFVLTELQALADSKDRAKRSLGRRGLGVVDRLQGSARADVVIREGYQDAKKEVDNQLIDFAQALHGRVCTTDSGLRRVAEIQGVDVMDFTEAARALRPAALVGETLALEIVRPGEEPGQGVGYLPEGSMVVVENGADSVGETVEVTVSHLHGTPNGQMFFAKLKA